MTDTSPKHAVPFTFAPDPENPGWNIWAVGDPARYNTAFLGKTIVRKESDKECRVRIFPEIRHTNSVNNVHGGTTLGLIDISLFAAAYTLRGIETAKSSTIDLSTQFIAAGDATLPLDAIVEFLRETHRLAFLRGLIKQGDTVIASFTGTIRKPSGQPSSQV